MPTSSPAPMQSPSDTRSLTVTTGSRLHFGLFSFGRSAGKQYGGVGLMIESPSLGIRLNSSPEFSVAGGMANRITQAASAWLASSDAAQLPDCQIETLLAPPQHVGFGSGTQLASAVAAGLAAWHGRPICSAPELAEASGRAARSAIGTHGFLQGGLIVEDGKHDSERIGPLLAQQAFPEAWRVLLLWPQHIVAAATYSGAKESTAFRQMSPVSFEREAMLRNIATNELLPAVEAHDFERFSQAVYAYNHGAGECYRALQGGAYASSEVARLIEWLRAAGVAGVGQSSWGPLVFAFAPSQRAALALQQRVATEYESKGLRCEITSAMNTGALGT